MVIKLNYKNTAIILSLTVILTILLITYKNISFSADVPLTEEAVYVPIISYHEVKAFGLGKDVISPWEFESDLKYLAENSYTTITMSQLIDYVMGGTSLPDKPIILTFDDGYLNNYVYVLPLLKKYNMNIVFSVIGINIDDFTRVPDDNIDYSHVTWDQLNEMIDSGFVEVQNHTYNMHKT